MNRMFLFINQGELACIKNDLGFSLEDIDKELELCDSQVKDETDNFTAADFKDVFSNKYRLKSKGFIVKKQCAFKIYRNENKGCTPKIH